MPNPVIYVLLNGELKMSPGKAAAQAVHSAMLLSNESRDAFVEFQKRTVIVLEAKNSEQIKNLYNYINESPLEADYYIDEGANEVDPYSVTALACSPIDSGDEDFRSIFEAFPLYSGYPVDTVKSAIELLTDAINEPFQDGPKWSMRAVRRWLKRGLNGRR